MAMREPPKRKPAKPEHTFDAGAVFDPAKAKDEDFTLDLEAGRYKARREEAGDRHDK